MDGLEGLPRLFCPTVCVSEVALEIWENGCMGVCGVHQTDMDVSS